MSSQTQPSIATKPQINAFAQYLLALAAVIGCYSLYVKFAVPAIEGPPNLVTQKKVPLQPDLPSAGLEKSHLIPLLPKDAWELSNCKTLLTSSGTMLFQDFEQLNDGTIQVYPFTLISGLEQKPNATAQATPEAKPGPPIIMRCLKGANLQFDKPMRDAFNGGSKIESARLTGQVDIYRPKSAPNKNDLIHILTSNVQIERTRIFTVDDVLFSFGSNRGSGRNLLIDLAHEPGGGALDDFSSINGIHRLELAFLEKLRLEPTPEDDEPTRVTPKDEAIADSKDAAPSRKLFAGNKSPLEVTCDGPFVFEFETMTASFQERVIVQQIDAFQDNIQCEKLLLTFEGPDDPEPPTDPPHPEASAQGLDSELKLKHFVAEGSPAVVTSKSRSAKVSAPYLRFEVLANQIEARGDSTGEQLVTLVSPEYQMQARQLTYVIPDDESLGPLQALGPGHLLRVASGDQDEFFATWSKSLVAKDDPEQAGTQRIVLDGNAKIKVADETRVNADRVELLVWKIPFQVALPDGTIKQKWEYLPAQVFSTGNVSIASVELDGTADQLTATWSKPTNLNTGIRSNTTPQSNRQRVGFRGTQPQQSTTTGAPPRSYATTPLQRITPNQHAEPNPNIRPVAFDEETVEKDLARNKKRRPTRKTKFHGKTVDVQLVRVGKNSVLRDLKVTGDVSITEIPISDAPALKNTNSTPLVMTGEQLRLIPQGNESYRALISGSSDQPAKIVGQDLVLVGENINLDQAANKLWVEGNGSMQHRPSKPLGESNRTSPAESLEQKFTPEQLDVTWEGGMIFDGAKIYFEKNVLMSTEQTAKNDRRSRLKSFSQGLSVELKNPVSFKDLSDRKKVENFEVRELVLVDHVSSDKQAFQLTTYSAGAKQDVAHRSVIIENQTFDASGKLLEKQRINVPRVTIDALSGSMRANGPGTIATHRPKTPESEDANNPMGQLAGTDGEDGITFIQINFDSDLLVDSKQRQMIVTGNIRTIYSPVQDWQTTIDPDNVQGRRPGGVLLTCERLELAQWSPRTNSKPTSEMIATGNAHILNDQFEATADRVSYSQSADMLVIEGSTRSDAKLWFKQTANAVNRTHLVARKIRYRTKDQWTETEGVKNLNFNR